MIPTIGAAAAGRPEATDVPVPVGKLEKIKSWISTITKWPNRAYRIMPVAISELSVAEDQLLLFSLYTCVPVIFVQAAQPSLALPCFLR